MREFWIIFKQAYSTKAKTKSFIITTAIMVLGIFFFANMSKITSTISNVTSGESAERVLYVLDESNEVLPLLQKQFENSEVDLIIEPTTATVKELEHQVREEEIESFLVLAINDQSIITANYTSMSSIEFTVPMAIQDALQNIQVAMQTEKLSLTEQEVAQLFTSIQYEQHNISPIAKSEQELNTARVLVYILMFVIYFAVILYSGMIATEVATEKSSRVMEILISSVSPVKHMFAKVFGIGTLGLTQIIIYGVAGFVAFKTSSSELPGGLSEFFSVSDINPITLVYAVIFFLLGYFLYATLAALLGSLVSRTEDVQQVITPMTLLIIAAFLIAVSGLGNPELAYLKYASFFPFFTPLVMFLRVGMLDLPLWEPLLAIGIMVVTILLLGIFGAKVYRGAVLMYGPSRSLKDLKKAIQLGKE